MARASACEEEVKTAWLLFRFNWGVLGILSAAFAIAIGLAGFSINVGNLLFSLGFVIIYAAFAHANARSPARRDPQVMFVLGATAQFVLITVIMAPLTYVAAAANLPLQDANLLALDRMLGLDGRAYVLVVNERPALAASLSYGYTLIRWPIFAIPVLLAAVHRYRHLEGFTLAFALALAVTTAISALVPAIGVYQQIGLDPAALSNIEPRAYLDGMRDLDPVRDGTLRHLDLFTLAGIVTFPSFHAASVVLYVWALWPVRWMRPIALVANGAMLAWTPVDGGHYFIDLIAGIAVAVLAIIAARRICRAVTLWLPELVARTRYPQAATIPAELNSVTG
ncbi:MAG: phosphatase PAP2 family protein [Xanthobacteraceae bacterium]